MSTLAGSEPELIVKPGSSTRKRVPAAGLVLRVIVMKELRQTLPYLALAMCAAVIAIFITEWFRSHFLLEPFSSYFTVLLAPVIVNAVPLGSGVAGLLIGLMQPVADRNFDVWTFLVFRPVSPRLLFLGRAIAGTLIYGLATVVPVLLLMLYALSPMGGRFLLWQYTLPTAADLIAGYVYYWAGLLMMDRWARFYGSRGVPILLALGSSYVSLSTKSFGIAMLVSAFAIVVLAVAVWGSMNSHGFTLESVKRRYRAALAVAILCSFTVPLIGISTIELYPLWRQHEHLFFIAPGTADTTLREMALNGQFVDIHQHMTISRDGQRKTDYTTTSADGGSSPKLPPNPPASEWAIFYGVSYEWIHAQLPTPLHFRELNTLVTEDIRPGEDASHAEVWYWIPTEGVYRIYNQPKTVDPFTGVQHLQNGPLVGVVGKNGFQKRLMDAQPFNVMRAKNNKILTPDAVYQIDPNQKKVNVLFTANSDEQLLSYSDDADLNEPGRRIFPNDELAVFTTKRFVHVNANGGGAVSIPIDAPKEPGERILFTYFPVPSLWLMETQKDAHTAEKRMRAWRIYSKDGKLLETRPWSPLQYLSETFHPEIAAADESQMLSDDFRAGVWMTIGNPIAVVVGYDLLNDFVKLPDRDDLTNHHLENQSFWSTVLPVTTAAEVGLGIGALLWGIATGLLAWRYKSRNGWVWVILAMLCGPAAILTFVAVHAYGSRARCGRCGRRRLLTAEICPHCGAPFPTPAMNGTEIFSV